MLPHSENEALCRVGPGTVMGDLMRRYWHPILLSSEVSERDAPPVRVRVLGEDLVAFRDSHGTLGLLGANCPHRGAPLFFGRNEEGGLRCLYHGWKFDVAGRCLGMPNVPPESDYKDKIRHASYVVKERGGVVWAYLHQDEAPPLPDFEWSLLPSSHVTLSKQYLECNWVQGLEGDYDGSHISFLHAPLTPSIHSDRGGSRDAAGAGFFAQPYALRDPHPVIMVLATAFGLFFGTRRDAEEDTFYWRFTNYVMPYFSGLPRESGRDGQMSMWQPVDDTTTMVWRVKFRPERPFTAAERAASYDGTDAHVRPDDYMTARVDRPGSQWLPAQNRSNDYRIDRELQASRTFSGIIGTWAQDRALTEGMGPIADRTREHLGPSDVGIIQLRRTLLRAARALREHAAAPPGTGSMPRPLCIESLVLPRDTSWEAIAALALGSAFEARAEASAE